MKYLIDTCIFFNKLNNGEIILNSCEKVKRDSNMNCISNEILKELEEPIHNVKNNNELYTVVKNVIFMFKRMELIDINESEVMQKNLKNIRSRFYGWQTDTVYLQKLIKDGVITPEEVKSPGFRYKDLGECSLIAIALTSPETYTIVTDDNGKTYKFPDQNLFNTYSDVKVVKYNSWSGKIEDCTSTCNL